MQSSWEQEKQGSRTFTPVAVEAWFGTNELSCVISGVSKVPMVRKLPMPGASGAARKTPYSAVALAAAMLSMGPEIPAWAAPMLADMAPPGFIAPQAVTLRPPRVQSARAADRAIRS